MFRKSRVLIALVVSLSVLAACQPALDRTPDPFSFTAVTGVELGAVVTSDAITVEGIDAPTTLTVSGGDAVALVNGDVVASGSSVVAGDEVQVRITASDQFATTVVAEVTIGGVSAEFSVTTRGALPDTTPDAFSFTPVTGAEPGESVTSGAVTVAGIDMPTPASVSGDPSAVLIVNGADVTGDIDVEAGDEIQVRLTASAIYETVVTATVTIGGVSADFVVTTKVAPTAPAVVSFASAPATVLWGDEDVGLSWAVTGDVTSLTLTNDYAATVLDVTGLTGTTVTVPSNAPSITYTLTATNDELSSSSSDDLEIAIELWVCESAADEIAFADAGLEEALRLESAQIPSTGPITCADMQSLVSFNTAHFDGNEGAIVSLAGLQHAVNLEELTAQWNVITDLTPISNLTSMTFLNLDKNAFNDVEPLRNLVALEFLSVWDVGPTRDAAADGITDIEPLSGLTALTELYLSTNAISDISPVAGLTALETVYFIDNGVSDLSPLAGLTQLSTLRIGFNNVSDASVLAGLGELVWVDLFYNLLTDISALGGLGNLWAVELEGNYLEDISALGDNLDFPGAAGTGLEQEPLVPTASIGYNCLITDDTDPGYDGDAVDDMVGRGVTVVGFSEALQRSECIVGTALGLREVRLQQFREAAER